MWLTKLIIIIAIKIIILYFVHLYKIQRAKKLYIEINLSHMSSWTFASLSHLEIFEGDKLQSLDQ